MKIKHSLPFSIQTVHIIFEKEMLKGGALWMTQTPRQTTTDADQLQSFNQVTHVTD